MSATLKNLLLLVTAVLALVGGYWLAQALRQSETTPVTAPTYGGGAMIDFTLPDLDGKKHVLSEWRGKVIVLNFWATWCPPCREEIPLFIELQKQHGAEGVQIIGVATADNTPAVADFRQRMHMNYPILIGDDDAMQVMARYGNRLGSLPFTVIIDGNGSIAVRKLGPFTRTELEDLLTPDLLPSKSPK